MVNTSRLGFRPVKSIGGEPFEGGFNMYFIPASDGTAVYKGDMVKLAGDADSTTGVPTVARASTTDVPLLGVVVGFAPDPTNLNIGGTYRAASTARYVYVADNPETLFEAQGSASVTTTMLGNNASIDNGTGSTTTGFSSQAVDVATVATTAALGLKIVAFKPSPDNEFPGTADKVFVKINNHSYGTGTGATGV